MQGSQAQQISTRAASGKKKLLNRTRHDPLLPSFQSDILSSLSEHGKPLATLVSDDDAPRLSIANAACADQVESCCLKACIHVFLRAVT